MLLLFICCCCCCCSAHASVCSATTGVDSNGGKEKMEGKRGEVGADRPRTLFDLPSPGTGNLQNKKLACRRRRRQLTGNKNNAGRFLDLSGKALREVPPSAFQTSSPEGGGRGEKTGNEREQQPPRGGGGVLSCDRQRGLPSAQNLPPRRRM